MAGETEHSRGGTSASVRPGALSALLRELAAAPPSVTEPGDWDSGLRAGALIGRFELVRELGRGGYGVVWEAKDRVGAPRRRCLPPDHSLARLSRSTFPAYGDDGTVRLLAPDEGAQPGDEVGQAPPS